MSRNRNFQPLATSTPNSKSVTVGGSAVCVTLPVNKHVTADNKDNTIWRSEGDELRAVNRRVLSSGWLLTEEEKLLLFKICNGRPVT